jgi:hypothetical protein
LESELQRIARRLVECLDELPKVAGDLREQANWCREKAALVGQLARGDPKGSQIAALLDGAARRCEEAAETCLKAHQPGRDWAMEQVGDAGASAGAASAATAGLRAEHPDPTPAEVREPSGEELTDEQSDGASRVQRFFEIAHENLDDLTDAVSEYVETWEAILDPPQPSDAERRSQPGTHSETRQSHPVMSERSRDGSADVGDTIGAALSVALVVAELGRRLHDRQFQKKGQRDVGH